MTADTTLSRDELNRALLARQGLLEPFGGSLTETVEAIGAIQAQYWPAVAAALFSRMNGITLGDVYDAFERRELVVGSLIRGTIHAVSAAEYPVYSAVAELSGANVAWHTGVGKSDGMTPLRTAALEFAADEPKESKEFAAFAEEWLAANPGAIEGPALDYHRSIAWRRVHHNSALIRVPPDGRWSVATGPKTYIAGRPAEIEPDAALAALVRRHLSAFGPSAAEDVAAWLGTRVPVTREALDRLGGELVRFTDDAGRTLYDLPGALLPGADVPAPPRLLAKFDSVLLAHAVKFRTRIIADEFREAVYFGKNLQLLPTYLIDGYVAGTWSVEAKKKLATLTLQPLAPLRQTDRAALAAEAERVLKLQCPDSTAFAVVIAD